MSRMPASLRRDERGQTVVLVALLLAMLMGFTALAVDAGRFYMERRFLQNAADAAALACAQKLTAGGTASAAETAARTLLNSYNLTGSPNGTAITVATTPVYTGWFNGDSSGVDKRNLADGIAVGTNNCRVALRANVRMIFIPIVNPGLGTLQVPANAHARVKGGQLPIIVNRFDNPPGPGGNFHDYARQEASDMNCDDNDADGDEGSCPWATEASPGRERVLVGNGYSSSDSNFRGFVALDVRDFSTLDGSGNPVHQYYNGTQGMNANTLKDKEAAYFSAGGYPGPEIPAYDPTANPAQAGLQLAIISGSSTGIAVTNMKNAYQVGTKVLVQLFDGQVQEVPDFTLNPPSSIDVTSPQANGNGPTFRVGANQNFRSANNVVTLRMARDTFNGSSNDTPAGLHGPTTQNAQFRFDPGTTDPPLGGCPNAGPPGFSGGCFTPSGGSGTQVRIKDVEVDSGVASGIYSMIIRGTGYTPSGLLLSTKQVWVPVKVGSVTRDFQMVFTSTSVDVALNATATFTFQLSTGAGTNAWGTASPATNVSFAIEYNGCASPSTEVELKSATGTVYCRTGVTISPTSALPDKNNPPTVTITVPTSGLSAGSYSFVLRGRGTNQDGQPVVHVQQLSVNIDSTGGAEKKYVNVQGYAVFKIVSCTITNDSNAVCGKSISGKANSPDDPSLKVGKKGGLVPWDATPIN